MCFLAVFSWFSCVKTPVSIPVCIWYSSNNVQWPRFNDQLVYYDHILSTQAQKSLSHFIILKTPFWCHHFVITTRILCLNAGRTGFHCSSFLVTFDSCERWVFKVKPELNWLETLHGRSHSVEAVCWDFNTPIFASPLKVKQEWINSQSCDRKNFQLVLSVSRYVCHVAKKQLDRKARSKNSSFY